MKYIVPFLAILISCSQIEPEQKSRNQELEGKVYHFANNFDPDKCCVLPNSSECYSSTYIGFRKNGEFIQVSRCGGYDQTYSGTYDFRDTLRLIYEKSVNNEYYQNSSGKMIKRVVSKKDSTYRISTFIPDTCELTPYFIDPDVAKYGFSEHTTVRNELYGTLDEDYSIEQIIERMKICGEWMEL